MLQLFYWPFLSREYSYFINSDNLLYICIEYRHAWREFVLCNINKNSDTTKCTCEWVPQNTTLTMRMVHGSLREFDPKKKSVEDFHKRFEFYCVANGIWDDNTAKKKAIFIMLLGQETFTKLKVLAGPTTVNDFDTRHHCAAFDTSFLAGHY